jgi:phytoene synthase
MDLQKENEDVLKKHAKTFYLASVFLPSDAAKDASNLYRFAREVDDIVDENPKEFARNELGNIIEDFGQKDIDRCEYPFVKNFKLRSYELGMKPLYTEELLKGVGWDLDNSIIETEEEFYLYCYRVAGVVGLMMCFMLRVSEEAAYPHAIDLGLAMQMTNISRDIVEDLDRSRVYIPRDWLEGIYLNKNNIKIKRTRDLLLENVERILMLAEVHYESADRGMCYIPWRARFAILTAAKMYRAIGLKILKNPQICLEKRVYVNKLEKLKIILFCSLYYFHPKIWRKPKKAVPGVLHPSLFHRI